MEDGFPLFDPNDEAARQEQRLREYYEEFSANARQRLLAKTIVRPITVYDVLYPQTREVLLSKNVPFNHNLEEDAKIIRDRLIAKIVTDETDLEKISADFRNSMLARAKIQDDRDKLMRDGDAFRKNLIAKNSPTSSDIEKDSELIRRNNITKNKPNPSLTDNIDKNSPTFRENSLSKNSTKDQDLLRDSESFRNQFRKNDIHKNVPNNSDIEKDSDAFRRLNLAKNNKNNVDDSEELSRLRRESQLAKNASEKTSIEDTSDIFRKDELSKNSTKDQDLLRDSESIRNQFRKNDIHKNVPNKSDIERDNNAFRRNNLAKNAPSKFDIDKDSEIYRNNNLSKDAKGPSIDIDAISEQKRLESLSKNVPSKSNLESDSLVFRGDDLSKNVPTKSNLERDSAEFRNDDISKNKPKSSNLEIDSAPFRSNDLAANVPKESDLETDSTQFRLDDLAANVLSKSDLERDSVTFRKDDISANKPKVTDLEKDSSLFRSDDLSANVPNQSDLEADSVQFRSDDLSANKPNFTNLETDSVLFREDDLSANVPKESNLETDSVTFRNDDLSANIPSISNLEIDSVPFREDDLSANVPSTSDLATDSTPFLFNNLSPNVPNNSDLELDSVPFREDDLAANVLSNSNLFIDSADFRENNLSSNVPNSSNLIVDSAPFRNDDLAANVPVDTNIASDSASFRENNLSANVPSGTDLLTDSGSFRDDAISKNAGYGLLGINAQGAGTSAFLGISRVFTQGILVRQLLFSKNKPNNSNLLLDSEIFRDNNKVPNKWQLSNNEYTSTNENWTLGKIMQGSINTNIVDYSPLQPYYTPTAKAIFSTDDYIVTKGKEMQNLYGTSRYVDFPTGRSNREISDALYSVNAVIPKGGEFLNPFFKRQTYVNYLEGSVTSTIRKYAQERSTFNLHGLQAGNSESLAILNNFAQDGFQELIQKTIGSFKALVQLRTLTTPTNIIQKNGGTYYAGGAGNTDILRPTGVDAELGSAESMMAKTALGNPFEDDDFFTGKRGVRHIVNTIKGSDSPLAGNFDPQNSKAYIIGANRDGSPKVSRQRFTIANPYAPGKAGKLIFFIKNYSSGDQFFFPPYIQSISNTENANWNSINFLGRPEAVYTYNNSSRDASISFYVLTDYSQTVDIGRDWAKESMDKVSVNIDGHFTESDVTQNSARKLKEEQLQKLKAEQTKELNELKDKISENNAESVQLEVQQSEVTVTTDDGEGMGQISGKVAEIKSNQAQKGKAANFGKSANGVEGAALSIEQDRIQKELGNTESSIGQSNANFNTVTNYSESNIVGDNVYNINMTKREFNNGEIITKPEDTINRIDTMKKNLMFQPAFFSGDKVDFVRKVEFLSKLTRPAAAYEGDELPKTGFSFTKPPICHIHLGDWWNHDIVVNSVAFDYADAPWTLDGGRVQPMWVLVNISFNIIGPFKAHNARPPLSTDAGGMFSPTAGITSA